VLTVDSFCETRQNQLACYKAIEIGVDQ